jgi:hypothetical protein
MLVIEAKDRADDWLDRFKFTLVGNDPDRWMERMFPEWIQKKSADLAEDEDLDLEENVTYEFTQEITPEMARRMREELEEPTETITGREVMEWQ